MIVLAAMFAYAPLLIVGAPHESTMGLVQKIFYFHFPSWMAMFLGVFVSGAASVVFLATRRRARTRSPWPRPSSSSHSA